VTVNEFIAQLGLWRWIGIRAAEGKYT